MANKDNTPATWAKSAVEWAIKNDILRGDNEGNYKLNSVCTRQETMVFFSRLAEVLKRDLK